MQPYQPPSREAMEAERLAREARERTAANDELVITIYRVCGGIGIAIALLMIIVGFKTGHGAFAGRIIIRSIVFGGAGGGLFARGNSLARRRALMTAPTMPMPMQPLPPPAPLPQEQQQQQQQVSRWTD